MPSISCQRRLPYASEPVFDLVADVERYPEFVPGWRRARVVSRDGNVLMVEQSLGVRGFTLQFRTEAVLERPRSIRIQTREHPFRFLYQVWRFEPVGDAATRLSLDADYELRGLPMRRLISVVFDEGFRRAYRAFEERARETLG